MYRQNDASHIRAHGNVAEQPGVKMPVVGLRPTYRGMVSPFCKPPANAESPGVRFSNLLFGK